LGLNLLFFSVGNKDIPAGWNFTLFNPGYTSILSGQTWNFDVSFLEFTVETQSPKLHHADVTLIDIILLHRLLLPAMSRSRGRLMKW
jgi:hypothetical protein